MAYCRVGGKAGPAVIEDITLAGLDVVPAYDPEDQLAFLREAAEEKGPERSGMAVEAVKRLARAGADIAVMATARNFVLRNKLLTSTLFNQAVREAQREAGNAQATDQATALLQLAEQHYRLIRSDDGEMFAVRKSGPNIALMIGHGAEGEFSAHLIRLFYDEYGRAPSDEAEKTATKVLRARLYEQDPEPVHIRVAPYKAGIVLDLGTADGSCIIADADGWQHEETSPVVFQRGAGVPLPVPRKSDDGLPRLKVMVNADEEQFRMMVAWLVAALMPCPCPPGLPRGEQGSAKTTMTRILQRIVDPSALLPGALPKDERDFAIRMSGAHVQAFDNVSHIPNWLSDALCRAVTGDSYVTRTLYSNRGRTIFHYRKPILINTIDAGALRADLVERSMPLDLKRIPREDRRTERAVIGDDPEVNPGILDQLDRDHPFILAAILDLVCAVFRNASSTTVADLPRMADFGKILAVLDKSQGWKIAEMFSDLVDAETGDLIENDVFVSQLAEYIEKHLAEHEEWSGTSKEIRDKLTSQLPDADHPPKDWPPDATRAGGKIKRLAPSLRVRGIEADQRREGKKSARVWYFQKTASAASAASARRPDQGKQADTKADAKSLADAADADPADTETLADTGRHSSVGLAPTGNTQASTQIQGAADAADAADAANFYPHGDEFAGSGDSLRTVTCPRCRAEFQTATEPGEVAYCASCGNEWKDGK